MALYRLPDGHEKENTMVRKHWVLLLLLLVIFSVRLSFFAINEGNYYWDEAVYLHLAKNIHEGAYSSNLGEQYRAPLFPFILSFFGEEYAHAFLFLTVIASTFAVFLLGKELFNLKVRDIDCDFRLIRSSLMHQLQLSSQGGEICVELIAKAQKVNAHICEVPVSHYHRVYGRSQFFRLMNIIKALKGMVRLKRILSKD